VNILTAKNEARFFRHTIKNYKDAIPKKKIGSYVLYLVWSIWKKILLFKYNITN